LQQKLAGQKEPNIVLHVAKDVPIENAVKVMDIAYRNKYKIVLAVSPK
jgi:biopolymer transport protein ExbD